MEIRAIHGIRRGRTLPLLVLLIALVAGLSVGAAGHAAMSPRLVASGPRAGPLTSPSTSTEPLSVTIPYAVWSWTGDVCSGTATNFTVQFVASVEGGSGPFLFAWEFGDGSGSSMGPNVSHAYSSAPENGLWWAVTLSVSDHSGATANATLALAPPALTCVPAGGEGSGAPPMVSGALVATGLGVAVGCFALPYSRRPSRDP